MMNEERKLFKIGDYYFPSKNYELKELFYQYNYCESIFVLHQEEKMEVIKLTWKNIQELETVSYIFRFYCYCHKLSAPCIAGQKFDTWKTRSDGKIDAIYIEVEAHEYCLDISIEEGNIDRKNFKRIIFNILRGIYHFHQQYLFFYDGENYLSSHCITHSENQNVLVNYINRHPIPENINNFFKLVFEDMTNTSLRIIDLWCIGYIYLEMLLGDFRIALENWDCNLNSITQILENIEITDDELLLLKKLLAFHIDRTYFFIMSDDFEEDRNYYDNINIVACRNLERAPNIKSYNTEEDALEDIKKYFDDMNNNVYINNIDEE